MKRSSRKINSVAVFCASSFGNEHEFFELATNVGKHLALEGVTIIFGGSDAGLMGAVANGAISQDGQVIGVYPEDTFSRDVRHRGGVDLRLVSSMHERKATMYDLATHFIALPGGLGTFEEVMEILTWAQLGLHTKPCGLLNINNYFADFLATLQHAVTEQFLNHEHSELLIVEETVSSLLGRLEGIKP